MCPEFLWQVMQRIEITVKQLLLPEQDVWLL
jgi:hypothetical protein